MACFLHFSIYVSTKFGHHVKHGPVVVHKAAAELTSMLREEFQSSCQETQTNGVLVTAPYYRKQSQIMRSVFATSYQKELRSASFQSGKIRKKEDFVKAVYVVISTIRQQPGSTHLWADCL